MHKALTVVLGLQPSIGPLPAAAYAAQGRAAPRGMREAAVSVGASERRMHPQMRTQCKRNANASRSARSRYFPNSLERRSLGGGAPYAVPVLRAPEGIARIPNCLVRASRSARSRYFPNSLERRSLGRPLRGPGLARPRRNRTGLCAETYGRAQVDRTGFWSETYIPNSMPAWSAPRRPSCKLLTCGERVGTVGTRTEKRFLIDVNEGGARAARRRACIAIPCVRSNRRYPELPPIGRPPGTIRSPNGKYPEPPAALARLD